MLLTLSLLGTAFWLALFVYCRIRFKFAEKIPTVEPRLPFFGNGLEFFMQNSHDIFANLADAFQQERRIFKLSFGPIVVVCPTHPDLIQKALSDPACMDKPYVYDFTRLTRGLLCAPYDTWKVHRRVLNPTFNTRILNSFVPIFNNCVRHMIQRIKDHTQPGEPLDILEFTSLCTLSMICQTSLGAKTMKHEGTHEFLKGLNVILHLVGRRMVSVDIHPDWVYRQTRFFRIEMSARKFCYAFTDKIIEEKLKEFGSPDLKNNKTISDRSHDEVEDDVVPYKKPQIFIDQLMTIPLPDGTPFSHADITDHIYTMVVGGSDTSATQTAHISLLIAMHPEVQEKAVAEIRELFPTPDVTAGPDILKQLVYMERIIKEGQRLCPAVPILGRKTRQDLQLDEFTIPKENIVLMNVFDLHRREDLWGEDAHLFNPDRFLPENSKHRHPFAYLPFSGGPRGCIGSRYAMMSMQLILVELLRNFKLSTDQKCGEMKFKFKTMMQLVGEHRIFIEPRKLYD